MSQHYKNRVCSNSLFDKVLEGQKTMLMDGGIGTMIQAAGLNAIHTVPDLLNITHGDAIREIHEAYVNAGGDCITTNTFSTNSLKLKDAGYSVDEVYAAGVSLARTAGAKIVAADIGPLGLLLEPLGTLSFDAAYEVFAECAVAAAKAGSDLIIIETMADLSEAKAALLACLENTDLPVFETMTFDKNGRTYMGVTPSDAASTLSSMGASAVGANCSLGPKEMLDSLSEMSMHTSSLLVAQPNAGMPQLVDGQTCFDINPDDFASATNAILDLGVNIIGGCCGTNPAHISVLRKLIDSRELAVRKIAE